MERLAENLQVITITHLPQIASLGARHFSVVKDTSADPTLATVVQLGEPQVVSAGFDWSDGAIGAGLALGLVLLGWGAALATRHAGRAQTA